MFPWKAARMYLSIKTFSTKLLHFSTSYTVIHTLDAIKVNILTVIWWIYRRILLDYTIQDDTKCIVRKMHQNTITEWQYEKELSKINQNSIGLLQYLFPYRIMQCIPDSNNKKLNCMMKACLIKWLWAQSKLDQTAVQR